MESSEHQVDVKGLYHKKSLSQLPPNLNNALRATKHRTIQKQQLLQHLKRNQVTGQQLLVQGQQSNPLSPKHKETAFQYPPNGYY